ncbi:3'-5' exonuclease [Marinobacter sp. OP 3.4]|uniref:3'-5' exonuclease n=1 Tax=Marinobacter sp. OP 3.4 TaxID=3076501 RepID=UPI002E22F8B2
MVSLNDHSPLLVIDLEATCWESRKVPSGQPQSIHNMEIIEFGCALATRGGTLLDSKSFLVRPVRHPHLSGFCTELTGINQTMVDTAPEYVKVCQEINTWLGCPTKLNAGRDARQTRHLPSGVTRQGEAWLPLSSRLVHHNLRLCAVGRSCQIK